MNSWTTQFLEQFETKLHQSLQSGSAYSELISYQFYPAGKRIRPLILAALALDLSPEQDQQAVFNKILNPCCALEILHTASLIHDDLPTLDNDLERRGQPTLHVKAGAAKALLIGDLLISKAFSVCASNSYIPTQINTEVSAVLADSFSNVCLGQIIDVENACHSEQQILDFYDLKTGALFFAAIESARLIANKNTIVTEFADFARSLGLAFQVKNDLTEIQGQRSTDSDNQRKTIFSVVPHDQAQYFFDSLLNQTLDKVALIENSNPEISLHRTRQILKTLF